MGWPCHWQGLESLKLSADVQRQLIWQELFWPAGYVEETPTYVLEAGGGGIAQTPEEWYLEDYSWRLLDRTRK